MPEFLVITKPVPGAQGGVLPDAGGRLGVTGVPPPYGEDIMALRETDIQLPQSQWDVCSARSTEETSHARPGAQAVIL